ncbi:MULTISPECIES: hypothetical protein [Enterobacter cloacae complex]|uniref:hypothetical protein n=1 Tax=Enterobacter cloacae complex TaxID=354276 RepID=UPI00079916B0|nr:hypothetical protein [Enterobacter cloacae]SAH78615.1 Uncharacterised protein [Enterobacter cloacae]
MITLTKEWLMKTIAELEEERDAVPGAVNEDAAMALAAMKLALASLEAEPVITVGDDGGDALAYRRLIQNFAPGTKLYTSAPPQPLECEPVAEIVAWRKEERTCDIRLCRFDLEPGPLFAMPQLVMKNHQISDLVNELHDIAVEYNGTIQLRDRIARAIRTSLRKG